MEALSQIPHANNDEFDTLLSLIESGVSGLLNGAFHPKEARYYKENFVKKSLHHFVTLLKDQTSPFYTRLLGLQCDMQNAKLTPVIKPSVTIGKFSAAVGALVAGVVGVSTLIPKSGHEVQTPPGIHKPDIALQDSPQGDFHIYIPVDTLYLSQPQEGNFDSPYIITAESTTLTEYARDKVEKEKKLDTFHDKWKKILDSKTGSFDYRKFIFDLEKYFGMASPKETQDAEKKYEQLRSQLASQTKDLSDLDFLHKVRTSVHGRSSTDDNRVHRSYITDLLNDPELVGNCDAQFKVRLALISDLRPALLPDIRAQLFSQHINLVYKKGKKLRAYSDYHEYVIPRSELDRTAIVDLKDYLVRPVVEDKMLHVKAKRSDKAGATVMNDSPFSLFKAKGLMSAVPSHRSAEDFDDFSYKKPEYFLITDEAYRDPNVLARELRENADKKFIIMSAPYSSSDALVRAFSGLHHLERLEMSKEKSSGRLVSPLLIPSSEPQSRVISSEDHEWLASALRGQDLQSLVLSGYSAVSSPNFDRFLKTQGKLRQLSLRDVTSLSPETIEIFSQIPLKYLIANARTITPNTMGAWKKYLEWAFKGMGWRRVNTGGTYFQKSTPTFMVNSPEDVRRLVQLTGQIKKNGNIYVVAPFVTNLHPDIAELFSDLPSNTTLLLPNLTNLTQHDLEAFSQKVIFESMSVPGSSAKKIKGVFNSVNILNLAPDSFGGLFFPPGSVSTNISPHNIRLYVQRRNEGMVQ